MKYITCYEIYFIGIIFSILLFLHDVTLSEIIVIVLFAIILSQVDIFENFVSDSFTGSQFNIRGK